MTAAAFSIFYMGIKLEHSSVIFCSTGAAFGMVFGLHVLSPAMSPPMKKMFFVSIWFSFALALLILNLKKKRRTYDEIANNSGGKRAILLATGFLGGNFSAFAGSGVDICSFALLTLLFHVSEKVATPTSVVLMAVNSVFGVFWRQFLMEGCAREALEYLATCVPIVTICAPLGSVIASHFHRQTLAAMIYVLETVALISGFAVVRPNLALTLGSLAIIFGGAGLFYGLSRLGEYLLSKRSKKSVEIDEETSNDVEMNTSTTDIESIKNKVPV